MKPNEEELKLLEEIINLTERLQNVQMKVVDFEYDRYVQEASLPAYSHLPTLTPVYHLRAHVSRVHDVVWTPLDKYLLTVGAEGCVVIWETQTGLIYNVIDVSNIQPIVAAASKDASKVFCGGLCANIVLFNSRHRSAEDGYSIYENNIVYEHSGQVSSINCIGETQFLSTSATDGAIIWDVEKAKKLNCFPHPSSVQCSSILSADGSVFLTGCEDGTIRQWDSRQPNHWINLFEAHQADVNCLRNLPNEFNFVSGGEDAFIHLYDIRSDVALARLSEPSQPSSIALPDPETGVVSNPEEFQRPELAAVCDIAVSSSGRLLISGCKDSLVYYWDIAQPNICLHIERELGPVMKVAMSNKKNALAMMTWDPKTRIRILRPQ